PVLERAEDEPFRLRSELLGDRSERRIALLFVAGRECAGRIAQRVEANLLERLRIGRTEKTKLHSGAACASLLACRAFAGDLGEHVGGLHGRRQRLASVRVKAIRRSGTVAVEVL